MVVVVAIVVVVGVIAVVGMVMVVVMMIVVVVVVVSVGVVVVVVMLVAAGARCGRRCCGAGLGDAGTYATGLDGIVSCRATGAGCIR